MSRNAPSEQKPTSPHDADHGNPLGSSHGKPTLPPILSPPLGSRRESEYRANGAAPGGPPPPAGEGAYGGEADSQSRPFHMNSILNPSSSKNYSPTATVKQEGYRPAGTTPHTGSPPSSTAHVTPNRSLPPVGGGGSAPAAPGYPGPRGDERRANPIGTISMPSAPVEAKQSPFLPPTGTPQSNASPMNSRMAYPFPQQGLPQPSTLPPEIERRGSESRPNNPSQSQNSSPSTSYSHGHTTQNSPALAYGGNPGPMYLPQPSHMPQSAVDAQMKNPAVAPRGYPLMFPSDQGPIPVPVDMQAASKLADEKRKRNAGASARFRQRRKEKEREAVSSIQRLEQRVRELEEEREFYRVERDYFRDLVYKSPTPIHVPPRHPSPNQRKAAAAAAATSNGNPEWQQAGGERGNDEGRNQRRRISGYMDEQSPTSYSQPSNSAPPPPPPPPPYQPPNAPYHTQPPAGVPEGRQPGAAPPQMHAPPYSGPPPSRPYERQWPGQ